MRWVRYMWCVYSMWGISVCVYMCVCDIRCAWEANMCVNWVCLVCVFSCVCLRVAYVWCVCSRWSIGECMFEWGVYSTRYVCLWGRNVCVVCEYGYVFIWMSLRCICMVCVWGIDECTLPPSPPLHHCLCLPPPAEGGLLGAQAVFYSHLYSLPPHYTRHSTQHSAESQ